MGRTGWLEGASARASELCDTFGWVQCEVACSLAQVSADYIAIVHAAAPRTWMLGGLEAAHHHRGLQTGAMKRANNNSMQRFCSRFLAYTAVRPHSHKLYLWNTLLSLASLYSVVATPLLIVFPSARYAGHATVEALLDIAFLFGVFIKLRTTHISRDGDAHSAFYSARVYMREQRLYRRPASQLYRSSSSRQPSAAPPTPMYQRSTLCAGSSSYARYAASM